MVCWGIFFTNKNKTVFGLDVAVFVDFLGVRKLSIFVGWCFFLWDRELIGVIVPSFSWWRSWEWDEFWELSFGGLCLGVADLVALDEKNFGRFVAEYV